MCTFNVHKLRLQDLAFFDYLPPSINVFYGIKVYKKLIFFDHLPPSSCKRSLWTPPYNMNSLIKIQFWLFYVLVFERGNFNWCILLQNLSWKFRLALTIAYIQVLIYTPLNNLSGGTPAAPLMLQRQMGYLF